MPPGQTLAHLRWQPTLPVAVLVALAALCLASVALAAWRRASGAWWRGAAFGAILLVLAGPTLVREQRQLLPDIALVVVDNTASMRIGDRVALRDAARDAIARQAAAIPGLELRMVFVPGGGGDGTRLFAAINHALTEIPRARLAGIIALTDGEVHDIPTTPPPAPLHVLLPAAGEQQDRTLRVLEAPGFGLVGQSATLRVRVDDLGADDAGATVPLSIRHDGEAVRVQTVPVGQDVAVTVPITRAGPNVVDLQVAALPGEVSALNNRAVVQLNGVRDRLRVLLVSGQPHGGERTWRRLLKSDPAVDLVHFTILRLPERDDMTPLSDMALIAFPVRELFQTRIRDFDLIILDRFQDRGLLPSVYLQNIADYVRAGGALLLSVGPEFAGPQSLAHSPLGDVLPARPGAEIDEPFRPRLGPAGERHPVTADLPGARAGPGDRPGWGAWYRRIEPADPHGEALLVGPDGAPLLLLDRVGKGRVALLLSDQIWLWARGHDGGGPQAELLRRLAHWLMGQPELEENALRAQVEGGRLVVSRRSLADDLPTVTVTDPDGHARSATLRPTAPGRAETSLPATAPGVWTVTDGAHTAYAAAADDDPAESADLRVTATKLAAIARASGGGTQFLQPGGAPRLEMVGAGGTASGHGWIGLRRNGDGVVTGITTVPLLPAALALPILLALIGITWFRERR